MRKEMIWCALLAAILMLIVTAVHGQSPRRYVSRTNSHIASVVQRLAKMDRSGDSDTLYMLRAEMDLELVRFHLNAYRHGRVERVMVDSALAQLDRDMEDYPPQVASK